MEGGGRIRGTENKAHVTGKNPKPNICSLEIPFSVLFGFDFEPVLQLGCGLSLFTVLA
jgi:hypothetical protein